MDAMETKLFRKLDDDEKNDEFIAVESCSRGDHFDHCCIDGDFRTDDV